MEAVERFKAAVAPPALAVRLDIAAFAIAACAHPSLDIDRACARLDELANECGASSFDDLRIALFTSLGFAGNGDDYGDPENSFLDSVLDRRLGIPITLSVLMMEIGRRAGIGVHGIGMPGHFLVQDANDTDVWCNPFHGGARYDLDDCRRLFERVHGNASNFSRALLVPASAHAILARMLANLEHGRLATDPRQLAWMCELHLALPDLRPSERSRIEGLARSVHARWN